MKIYVDLSCDKISGQQNMQRALKNYVIERGLFAEKQDADILVYVQVPFDDNIYNEWLTYKKMNKLIVFIHHYMSKSFYERCAIFKVSGLFDLIDYHICTSKECELYDYLLKKVDKNKIYTQELGASEFNSLIKYFKRPNEKINKSICFVGKAIKGLNRFLDFCLTKNFNEKYILCPDIDLNKYDYLDDFKIYTNKTYDEVYEIMSKCQFIYCPSVYNTPSMHLEMVIQEAIPCGCIPIVSKEYQKIMHEDDLAKIGFMQEDKFTYNNLSKYQDAAIAMQRKNYYTLSETLSILVTIIMNLEK